MTWDDFVYGVAIQENRPLFLQGSKYRVFPNAAPEKNGGMDIGFGHKITQEESIRQKIYGHSFSNGLSMWQVCEILEVDLLNAEANVAANIGISKWSSLPDTALYILTDFMFNGAYYKFPRFRRAILEMDFDTMFLEYKRYWTDRYNNKRELTERNAFTERLIGRLKDEVHD